MMTLTNDKSIGIPFKISPDRLGLLSDLNMSMTRSEPEYEAIARICKGEDPIPRLMKMLEDPATVMHDKVQEAILYLMEAKHQWREIV